MHVKAMDQLGSSNKMNAVSFSKRDTKPKGLTQDKSRDKKPCSRSGSLQEEKEKECFRCSKTDHLARDRNCPARNKKCNACGQIGHFAVCCKVKERKRRARDAEKEDNTQSGAYQVMGDPGSGSQDFYAFLVGVVESSSGGEVNLNVGGVMLFGVLIDSGASCNLIDRAT